MRKKVLALRTSDSPLETDSSFQHMGFSLHTTLSTLDPDAIVENLASLLHRAQASQTPEEKEPLLTKVIQLTNQTLRRHDLVPADTIRPQLTETYIQAFEMMGDLFFEKAQSVPDIIKKRELITYASALFNHALMMAQKHPSQNFINQSQLIHRLTKNTMSVEGLFLSSISSLQASHATPISHHIVQHTKIEHKETLERLRITCEEEMARIDTMPRTTWKEKAAQSNQIQILYQRISGTMKQLITEMIQECETALGTPPCHYAVIGLGSLARGEMTPYSDLEWAILIDDQDRSRDTGGDAGGVAEPRHYTETEISANKEYFRNLTTLLHIKVLNLGETIIPAMDIPGLTGKEGFHDVETPRGFAFDGQMATARKTPLGKQANAERNTAGDYELIQTPSEMTKYQLRDIEAGAEQHYRFLNQYHLPTVLSHTTYITGSDNGIDLLRNYRQSVKAILAQEMTDTHTPLGKERALRLLKSDLEKFDPKMGDINEQGKSYDVKKEIYRLANTILDALAIYYDLESESSWDRIAELHRKGHLANPIAEQALKNLVSHTTGMRLRTYLRNKKQQEFMGVLPPDPSNEQIRNAFQLNDVSLLFEIYYTLMPFFEGAKRWTGLTELDRRVFSGDSLYCPDDLFLKGRINMRLLRYAEAEKCFKDRINENDQNIDLINELAIVECRLENYREAEENFQKVLDRQVSHYGTEEHVDVATTYNHLGLILSYQKDYINAKCRYEKAIAIYIGCYGTDNHINVAATYHNLGNALSDQGNYIDSKIQFENALRIKIEWYGTEEHIDVASTYNSIGTVFCRQKDYLEAENLYKKALFIQIECYGTEEHIDVASTYYNLGDTIAKNQSNYLDAKYYFQKSLSIFQTKLPQNHSFVQMALKSTQNVSLVLGLLERDPKTIIQVATIHLQRNQIQEALAIYCMVLDDNPEMITELPQIPKTLGTFGDVLLLRNNPTLAILFYEQALVLDPQTSIHHNLACAYSVTGNLPKADEVFKKGIQLNPTARIHAEYALFLSQQFTRDENAIIHHCQESIHRKTEPGGLSYGQLEKNVVGPELKQEIEQFGEISLSPCLLSYRLLIQAYLRLGQREPAQVEISKFQSEVESYTDGKSPLVWSLLGYAYQELGMKDRAIASFQKALELKPDYVLVEQNLALLNTQRVPQAQSKPPDTLFNQLIGLIKEYPKTIIAGSMAAAGVLFYGYGFIRDYFKPKSALEIDTFIRENSIPTSEIMRIYTELKK